MLFLENLFYLFLDMSFYIMIGLLIVGVLHSFVDKSFITRQIGKSSIGSVIKASILGVPLPLCSCGVVPTAVELKKQGGSNGAVVSFLISTPQTGVDSIIATGGILGWFMAGFRAVAAFISGIVGGITVNIFGKNEKINSGVSPCGCESEKEETTSCCCSSNNEVKEVSSCSCENEKEEITSCCCSSNNEVKEVSSCSCENEKEETTSCCGSSKKPTTFKQKFINIFTYGFGSFLNEIAIHFIIGIIISALITTLIPEDFFVSLGLNNGILSMLLMVILGLPMYICSTSSIPIALSLVMKGLSPAAAFVFLFTGPVSNFASFIVILKTLGKKITALYIGSVIVMALIFGYIFELIIGVTGYDIMNHASHMHEHTESIPWYYMLCGGIFFILLIRSVVIRIISKVKKA